MPERNLSPAVQRVLDRAREQAQEAGREPFALDLLHALLADEGQASELLRGAGVAAPDRAMTIEGARQNSLSAVLRTAMRQVSEGDDVSSLHLLLAMVECDVTIAACLTEHGLPPADIHRLARGEPARVLEPLPTDIQIAPVIAEVDNPSALLRILDAASNRAREGLRVLEDYARFALNDAVLLSRLKTARHRLAERLQSLLGDRAIRLRDTPGDVGTTVHTDFEARREEDADVLRANACRTQEALRTLEEFGKRLDPDLAAQIGELRYETYTLERALLAGQAARERLQSVNLCLLVTDALCPQGGDAVVQAALQGGSPMIQLREKTIPDGALLERARRYREWTRAAGALFIVNDRPDLALLVDADGVHLGQDDLSVAAARRIVGGERLVGVSTHDVGQIRQAVLDGADYLGVGPVFPSRTKSFDDLAGLAFVQQAAAETSLPWFAIGGITAENLPQLRAAGGQRIAVSAAICRAEDPAAATRDLLRQLNAE